MFINFPLLSIPLYYVLAFYPHARAISVSTKGDLSKHDNRNPKSSTLLEKIKQRLSPEDFATYERCVPALRVELDRLGNDLPTFYAAMKQLEDNAPARSRLCPAT